MTTAGKRTRGRPRTGPRLVKTKTGYSVRTYVTVDGIEVLQQFGLGTKSRTVANAKKKAIALGKLDPREGERAETFELAARRIVDGQPTITAKNKRARLRRLEKFAFPLFGDKPAGQVDSTLIKDALHECRLAIGDGKVTRSVGVLLGDISSVLASLYSDNLIKENAADRVSLAKDFGGVQAARAPRIVLTIPEFERFALYHLGKAELDEVVMMSVAAWFLGGMRTSDLHAWTWEHIDTREWQTALVPRPKTKKNVTLSAPHKLDSELVPVLQRWWIQEGCPVRGPVFPIRRDTEGTFVTRNGEQYWRPPSKAGDHKRASSYALPLRHLLWEAGVVRPMVGFEAAENDNARRALCEIQSGGAENASVDFHSFRRAAATAAAASGMNIQQAMALLDHSSTRTHMGYVRNQEALVSPKSMLPNLGFGGQTTAPEGAARIMAPAAPLLPSHGKKKSNDSDCLSMPDPALTSCSSSSCTEPAEPFLRGFPHREAPRDDQETPLATRQRQNSVPIIRDALGALAEGVHLAVASGQWDLAADIVAIGKKHSATLTPPSNVTKLDDRRKR